MKKTNNKGFSLVELIIVIAIMAVLVGILAPQFIQYVEKSRKSTDIKNAQEIATAIQVGVAGSEITLDVATAAEFLDATTTAIALAPTMKTTAYVDQAFWYTVNVATGEVHIFAGLAGVATAHELYPTVNAAFE